MGRVLWQVPEVGTDDATELVFALLGGTHPESSATRRWLLQGNPYSTSTCVVCAVKAPQPLSAGPLVPGQYPENA